MSRSLCSWRFVRIPLLAVLVLAGSDLGLAAEEPTPEQLAFFEKKIRPVLVEHCYECHAADSKSIRGGLLLDTREGLLTGGDTGPAIEPGDAGASLLIESLRYESYEMPPEGKLPEHVIADFETWVNMGAPDPRDGSVRPAEAGIDLEAGRQFWSFQPPQKHTPPELKTFGDWARSDIDRFLAAKWEEQTLEPAVDADKRALVRRAYFDLTGLPPSPEEVEAFVSDDDPEAFARLIDRLLDSPRFGERWGRHWLDLARYADTTGGGRSLIYEGSWRYRDYVIDAFNQDKPYDQFIREQLAGDLLPAENVEQAQEQMVATGFLLLGPHNYENQDKQLLDMEIVDEQLDTLGRVFLGMTIGCARCHDHKFDPIPTADYYAMAGILRSTRSVQHSNVSRWNDRELPVDEKTRQQIEQHDRAVAALTERQSALQKRLAAVQSQFPAITVDNTEATFRGEWTPSQSIKGYVGENYVHANAASSPEAEAVYRVKLPKPGLYEVRLSYTASSNRSPDAKVKVAHAAGETVLKVNQQEPPRIGNQFQPLQTFAFNDTATITLATEGTSGVVIADAVQLVAITAPETKQPRIVSLDELPGIVVDDTAASFTGDWQESQYVKSYAGSGYHHDMNADKGNKTATFRAELPESGFYEVRYAYHEYDSRADRVKITVTHGKGEQVVHLSQRQTPDVDGLFASLGRYWFNAPQDAEVQVSTEGSSGFVIVDAVQFLPVAEMAEEGEQLADAPDELSEILAESDRLQDELAEIDKQLNELKKSAPPRPPKVMAVAEADPQEIDDCPIHIRGDHRNLGEPVERGFLQVAYRGESPEIPSDESGRLEMADWIASQNNPLTARVMVNRVWQHLWGQGLVRTVDNFGTTGETPSHPELLDTLAVEFMEDGWSVKRLIRRMMLSRAYQISSDPPPETVRRDAENRALAYRRPRRLEAEAIYDAILSLSGQLDLAGGGNTLRPGTRSEYGYQFDDRYRAVYLPVLRNNLHPLTANFDFPNPNLSTGQRTTSTLATQALLLLNSPFVLEQAQHAAERLIADEAEPRERLNLLYLRALGREPTSAERERALNYLRAADENGRTEVSAWSGVCQAVMGSIDFRYID